MERETMDEDGLPTFSPLADDKEKEKEKEGGKGKDTSKKPLLAEEADESEGTSSEAKKPNGSGRGKKK